MQLNDFECLPCVELNTDRHNMILFLQHDTAREFPVGYEEQRSNFFDPLDDEIYSNPHQTATPAMVQDSDSKTRSVAEIGNDTATASTSISNDGATPGSTQHVTSGAEAGSSSSPVPSSKVGSTDELVGSVMISAEEQKRRNGGGRLLNRLAVKASALAVCARPSCRRKPRHDSMFCSDGCGVAALEIDLLRSLEYSRDIHPAHLRT